MYSTSQTCCGELPPRSALGGFASRVRRWSAKIRILCDDGRQGAIVFELGAAVPVRIAIALGEVAGEGTRCEPASSSHPLARPSPSLSESAARACIRIRLVAADVVLVIGQAQLPERLPL